MKSTHLIATVIVLLLVAGAVFTLRPLYSSSPVVTVPTAVSPTPIGGVITTTTTTSTTTTTTPTPHPAPPPVGTGTLAGSISIGPVCPVEQAGHPCTPTPEMYAAHVVSVYTADHSKVLMTLTPDAHGAFSAKLSPGTYVVDVQHQAVGSTQGAPSTVIIKAGESTSVSISIDTGIR